MYLKDVSLPHLLVCYKIILHDTYGDGWDTSELKILKELEGGNETQVASLGFAEAGATKTFKKTRVIQQKWSTVTTRGKYIGR